ncbi:MAG: hypothetical protein HC819_01500 [Cyclobacteriaceae bacterium]|nr:hypothetical protein [Cyclobacteriaceae bacterium]
MPFEKGHQLAKGRPKGAMNKINAELIAALSELEQGNREKAFTVFEAMFEANPAQFLQAYFGLVRIIAPKQLTHNMGDIQGHCVRVFDPKTGKVLRETGVNIDSPNKVTLSLPDNGRKDSYLKNQ